MITSMASLTDKQVKEYVDSMYIQLKDKEDYVTSALTYLRFSEEDRLPQDEEFIKNGCKIIW